MDTEELFAAKCEEYAEAQGLRELMESLMRLLLQKQPKDPLQCLIDYLQQHQQQLESQGQQEEQQEEKAQQKQGPLLRLVLLGLPGSGRREVSRQLAEKWDLPLVSAGDILRLHAEKFPKGEAARAIATKTLASDELVIDLVMKRLQHQHQLLLQGTCRGWILDGFPRTRRQAVAFLQMRLSPDRCCLLLPPEETAKAAVHSAATSAAVAAAAAESSAASSTNGPHFRCSTTPATQRQARLQLAKEADDRLHLAYRHANGVVDILGPLAETVPAEDSLKSIVDIIKVIGSCGSGKSRQSRILSKRFGVVHVDPRELLLQRAHEDEECRKALLELESGLDLSFDPLVGQLVANRLAAADCARRGWVLEGFPLTAHQAKLLRHHKIIPDCILCLEVPKETLVDRVARCKASSQTDKVTDGPSANSATDARKDAARLVELRTAQLERWLPAIRNIFPDKLTTICADDAVSVESVAERILEFLSRQALDLPFRDFEIRSNSSNTAKQGPSDSDFSCCLFRHRMPPIKSR